MIYTPDILRPSHDVKKYFFGSQKLLQFFILEDAVFSTSFLYSLEHFDLFGAIIFGGWHQNPAPASAGWHPHHQHRMSEIFDGSLFLKNWFLFLYLTQRKNQSQLFWKEIRKKIQHTRITIWKKVKTGNEPGKLGQYSGKNWPWQKFVSDDRAIKDHKQNLNRKIHKFLLFFEVWVPWHSANKCSLWYMGARE